MQLAASESDRRAELDRGPTGGLIVPLSQSDLAAANELDLANQARQGDHGAFTELVNRYARKVFRLARHITQNDQDAEDVLQDTFLKAYSRLDQFQGNSKFYTWLMRIGVNEALMRLRRRKGNQTVSLDDDLETGDGSIPREIPSEGSDPEENYGREELRESLDRAIDSLSESYRAVFLLRDVEGFSTEETGQMLGLSVSAVKSRLLRARLQLRGKLRRRMGQDGRQT